MGNLATRCDAASLAPCQRACTNCGSDDTTNFKQKLCTWAEEEVHTMGEPIIGMDYGFLGGWNQSGDSVHAAAIRCHARPPLYEPGSLVPLRGGDRKCVDGQGIHQYYTIDKSPLGRGSYGEVMGATHISSGARRAIKAVGKANLKRYVNNVTGFVRREVDILRRLDHPNIVRLYEAFEDEDTIYLVLELCEGGDLLERVAVARDRLPEKEAARLFMQMLASLQHLYLRGVIHRDLKPENFLFVRRENDREPLPPDRAPIKLIDFGLSRRISAETGVRMTPKIGTTEYMAPEAFAGRVNVALADRTDMWSLGVVLHVIFMGHFPSPRLAEQTPEEYLSASCWSCVSGAGRDLLGQLLRYDPSRRPTVTVAMKHIWLNSAMSTQKLQLMHPMPTAVQIFAGYPGMRRLALAAAAREMDDSDLSCLRALFQSLELECDGALTRQALERAAHSPAPVGFTAAELVKVFDCIDVDGSGTIDWTEFVAVSLGMASEATLGPQNEEEKGSTKLPDAAHGMPDLQEETCWRAFDILSQGTGAVSGDSLARLFVPAEVSSVVKNGGSGGGTGGSDDTIVIPPDSSRVSELDKLVQEVEPKSMMDRLTFVNMTLGRK